MNKEQQEEENNRNYKAQGCASHQRRPKNAIFINSRTTIRHEISKSIGGIMLSKYGDIKFTEYLVLLIKCLEKEIKEIMKDFPKEKASFITECVPLDNPKRRIDLLRLLDETPFELETDKTIKKEGSITFYI